MFLLIHSVVRGIHLFSFVYSIPLHHPIIQAAIPCGCSERVSLRLRSLHVKRQIQRLLWLATIGITNPVPQTKSTIALWGSRTATLSFINWFAQQLHLDCRCILGYQRRSRSKTPRPTAYWHDTKLLVPRTKSFICEPSSYDCSVTSARLTYCSCDKMNTYSASTRFPDDNRRFPQTAPRLQHPLTCASSCLDPESAE